MNDINKKSIIVNGSIKAFMAQTTQLLETGKIWHMDALSMKCSVSSCDIMKMKLTGC